MHSQFARKLHLTAAALGCTQRKALCARFRRVNPATTCDLDRLHKWMQGRAMPRGTGFFEDWRLVIGSERDAAWIEGSSVEAFADELARRAGITLDDLWSREERQQRRGAAATAVLGAQHTVYGSFACYSHAWSPRYRGTLIRGSLRIGPGPRRGVQATYVETLITGTMRLSGDVTLSGGMLHVLLRESANSLPLFLNVIAPGPPASVLCGILAGPALIAHAALPSATRFVAVRTPERGMAEEGVLEAGNRYIAREASVVVADLAGTGLRIGESGRAAEAVLGFLGEGPHQVGVADQAALCDLLDAAHSSGRGPGRD